jgi:N utilization substance protein A
MAATSSDFIAAIYQLADDYGVDKDIVLYVIKQAILTAYKKTRKEEFTSEDEEDDMSHYDVEINEETGESVILADKKVVSVVTDPKTQILESQAKLIDSRLREGDHIQTDVTPDNFGRIAAQAAKQRIMQGLRDAVRDAMILKYQDKVGKIVSGIVQRKDPEYVRVEIDRAEAIMPNMEQIPGEMYRSAERKRFLLLRLTNTVTDKRMVLSRASTDFLKALFELEVPEVATGNVEIINIAREAGSRSKVAVLSKHDKVDAIGACVGPRGTRIDSIMNEVNPEKVDIILWDKEIRTFIINSLSPAKVVDIKVSADSSYAKVLVNEDALSLAIGKEGQNVRLAAKLTGYKIDITADKEAFDSELKEQSKDITPEQQTELQTVAPELNEVSEETVDTNPVRLDIEVEDIIGDEIDLIDSLNLTDRQKNLLKKAVALNMEQLENIVKGETEVEGFTKKDIEKLGKSLSEKGSAKPKKTVKAVKKPAVKKATVKK